jgi:hypothetical protein
MYKLAWLQTNTGLASMILKWGGLKQTKPLPALCASRFFCFSVFASKLATLQNKKPLAFARGFGCFVGKTGFEPATPWSQTRCATGLRYFPFPAVREGFEPSVEL